MSSAVLLEAAGLTLAGGGTAAAAYRALVDPRSSLRRSVGGYQSWLDQRLRSLFLPPRAVAIMIAQGFAGYVVCALGVATRTPQVLLALVVVALAPWAVLEIAHRRRIRRIEEQTDGFLVALANALKASPSIAESFASLTTVIAEPLRSEITLAVKQMHLGCTFEEALLMLGARVGSRTFDSALSTILIGQRIGGNVPATLESAGAALRELSRLDAMVRARTANGRIQMTVIAFAPIVFVVGFGTTDPHFFDPLAQSLVGKVMLVVAVVCWASAIALGRRFLRVDF